MSLELYTQMPPPKWVESGAKPVNGLDLLGLRLPVQTIGSALLDGVTTITPSVRYLSILCWSIQVYGNARRPDSWDDFIDFTARVESAVAVANMLIDNTLAGIIGKTKAKELAEQENDSIPLEKLVSQLATGIYSNPSEQLGLTLSRGNSFPGLSSERGLVLAEAFGRKAQSTLLGCRFSSGSAPDSATRSELKEFGEIVGFNGIPDAEKKVLIEAILPPEPRPEERPRFQTYTCLLALADHIGKIPDEIDLFREAEAQESALPEELDGILDGWLRYRIRDVIAYVHEVVFGEIVHALKRESARLSSPVKASRVIQQLMAYRGDQTKALKDLFLADSREAIETLSFEELNQRCIDNLGRPVSRRGLRRGDGTLRESAIINVAASAGIGALVLIPVSWCVAVWRSEPWEEDLEHSFENGAGSWSRMGLFEVIRPTIRQYITEARSLEEVTADLAHLTAERHLDIAWSRMAADTRDVAVFLSDGDRWHDRGRQFTPGRTASRIRDATRWLQQLGLLDDGITSVGKGVLGRCLQTIQSWEAS